MNMNKYSQVSSISKMLALIVGEMCYWYRDFNYDPSIDYAFKVLTIEYTDIDHLVCGDIALTLELVNVSSKQRLGFLVWKYTEGVEDGWNRSSFTSIGLSNSNYISIKFVTRLVELILTHGYFNRYIMVDNDEVDLYLKLDDKSEFDVYNIRGKKI